MNSSQLFGKTLRNQTDVELSKLRPYTGPGFLWANVTYFGLSVTSYFAFDLFLTSYVASVSVTSPPKHNNFPFHRIEVLNLSYLKTLFRTYRFCTVQWKDDSDDQKGYGKTKWWPIVKWCSSMHERLKWTGRYRSLVRRSQGAASRLGSRSTNHSNEAAGFCAFCCFYYCYCYYYC